jgi:hypothetical protein
MPANAQTPNVITNSPVVDCDPVQNCRQKSTTTILVHISTGHGDMKKPITSGKPFQLAVSTASHHAAVRVIPF